MKKVPQSKYPPKDKELPKAAIENFGCDDKVFSVFVIMGRRQEVNPGL